MQNNNYSTEAIFQILMAQPADKIVTDADLMALFPKCATDIEHFDKNFSLLFPFSVTNTYEIANRWQTTHHDYPALIQQYESNLNRDFQDNDQVGLVYFDWFKLTSPYHYGELVDDLNYNLAKQAEIDAQDQAN